MNAITIDLDSISAQIVALLPPDVSPDKFREVALAAIRQKPDLLKCDRQSLFNACLTAAQDGLLPDGREGAIVPRKNQAVWQPMILGIYKRVKSSGSVKALSANVVYAGEEFQVLLGDEDRIVHRRDLTKVAPGSEVAVYAIATLKDGTKEREVMTWEQVLVVRQTSATPNAGPWVQWPDEMARKTVVRRLAKRLPVLDQADEALHRTIGRVDSLYNFGTPEAPIRAAAAPMSRPARVTEKAPEKTNTFREGIYEGSDPLDEPDGRQWLRNLDVALANAQTQHEVIEIGGHHSVGHATANAPDAVKARVSELLANAYGRFAQGTEAPELPEVEIAGAERAGA